MRHRRFSPMDRMGWCLEEKGGSSCGEHEDAPEAFSAFRDHYRQLAAKSDVGRHGFLPGTDFQRHPDITVPDSTSIERDLLIPRTSRDTPLRCPVIRKLITQLTAHSRDFGAEELHGHNAGRDRRVGGPARRLTSRWRRMSPRPGEQSAEESAEVAPTKKSG